MYVSGIATVLCNCVMSYMAGLFQAYYRISRNIGGHYIWLFAQKHCCWDFKLVLHGEKPMLVV